MYYLAEYYTHRFGTFQAIADTRADAVALLNEGLKIHAQEYALQDWIDADNIDVKAFRFDSVLRDSLGIIKVPQGLLHA